MATKEKEYELSDGSLWTAKQLGEHLNLTSTAARCRLNQTSDAEIILRKRHVNTVRRKKVYKCRTFKLSDDSIISAEQAALRFDVNTSTMYARLSRGIRDIDELSKRPTKGRHNNDNQGYSKFGKQPKAVKEYLLERNFFDPMSRLFLKMA